MPKSPHRPAKKPLLRIPAEGDWGDYRNDMDQKSAHDQFGGRSNEEMQPYIRGTPIGAAGDLHFMPEIPFRYYVLGYRDYIMAGQFSSHDASDAASCFMRLVLRKLQEQPRYIIPVMAELLPAVEHVAHNQSAFHANESIYGNFLKMLKQIQALYAEARDRYRRL